MDLQEILEERQRRQKLQDQVHKLILDRYQVKDVNLMICKESAAAGNVYQYLSEQMNLTNHWKFKREVKKILLTLKLIKPTNSRGIIWFKGLLGLEEDRKLMKKFYKRLYQAKKRYRAKN